MVVLALMVVSCREGACHHDIDKSNNAHGGCSRVFVCVSVGADDIIMIGRVVAKT